MGIQSATISRDYVSNNPNFTSVQQVQGRTTSAEQPIVQSSPDSGQPALKKQSHEVQTISEQQVMRSIDRVLEALQGPNTSIEMSIHDKTKQVMVKVLNRDTGEIIREIPPEKMQDLVAKMIEIAGLLIDERV